MNLLREYIREMLKEQNVLAVGMCFPFAAKKAEEWFTDHFEARRGRAPKRHPDLNNKDKFKVVHGKITDQWKEPPKPIVHAWGEMGDLVFDDQTQHTKPNGVPKDVYYDMYQPEVVEEYTAEEAVVNCDMKGEGPWNKELQDIMKTRDAWMKESPVREYIREILNENKLRVFDFDDTLAVTDSMIILTKASGEQIKQTPGEWAVYKPEPGDEFDYSEFGGELMNPREIKDYMNILRRVLGAGTDGRKAVILTARAEVARQGIINFLEDIGLNVGDIEIVTLGESDPQFKAQWIEDKINDGYDDVYFVDDSDKNIRAVQALAAKYPDIKLRTQLV